MVSKNKQINIRVSVDEYEMVNSMNMNFSEIWRIGFEKWVLEYPDFLQKKQQEYKEMYSNCIAKLGKCYTNAIQKNKVLDDVYHVYISQNRSVENPDKRDCSWVKARLEKNNNGGRCSVEQFFEYCRKRFEDEKQRKLDFGSEVSI